MSYASGRSPRALASDSRRSLYLPPPARESTVPSRLGLGARGRTCGDDVLGQALCLSLVERDRRLGAAALVPDAEAIVPLRLGAAEVARDAECLTLVALELVVWPEELDELASLRRRAPGAVVEPRLHRSAAFPAVAHQRLLYAGGYNAGSGSSM